ncbi:MAG TPA: selenium-dependent xanthine dehydrogenase, partial [Clostridia bacterium]|nr:selenium-dependent xanthine dehydrogenase [Clostridia bacterium]
TLYPSGEEIKKALRFNICRCTGYKKIIEAIQLAAAVFREEISLESETVSWGLGERVVREDVTPKVTGVAEYVDDLYLPDMLYAKVLRSPRPRIYVKRIDTSRARALPGVEAVLTAENIPGHRFQGYIVQDWPALVAEGEETRYLGDALALVAAVTPELALQAVDLIEIEYEELEPITDPVQSLKEGSPQLHPAGNLLSHTHLKRGNLKETLEKCSHVITNRYTTPMVEHAFLEPESALAVPGREGLTVFTGTQSVHHDRKQIASLLGLPEDRVRIINKYVGGAFGGKEDLSVQHHGALLAWVTKKPVKLTLTREESLLVHPKRHPMEMVITTGCNSDGKILALQAEIAFDTGAYASLGGPVLERACTHATGPYSIPIIDINGYAVYTNNPPCGAFRGFGVPQSSFAIEGQLDLMAEKVGISPWEMRYRNALRPGDRLATGQVVGEDTNVVDTLLAVKEEYEKNPYTGIACAIKNAGLGVGLADTGRAVLLVEKGRLKVHTGAACIGQGLAVVLLQMVCETVDIDPELVDVVLADTGLTPDSGATTASRQSLFTGEAVRRAAEKLARDYRGGSLEELEGRRYEGEYLGKTDPLNSPKSDPVTHVAYGFATHVVILDEKGLVQKVIAAHDVGKIANPLGLEGQLEGGIVMGLGFALQEEFLLEEGVPQIRHFGKLGLFKSTQVPQIELIFVEKGLGQEAYGVKGVGEIACIPTAGAVAGAYYKYDGRRRFSLPL